MASSRAGWAFVHTGELDRAEAVFREYIRTRKGQQKDYGRVGLGCVLLAKGKGAEAEQVWQAVTRKFSQPGRSVGLFWAALGRKDAPAGKQANAYTALGMIRRNKYGTNRGERIYFIIPGSPLAAARPKVQVDDRVISVGEMYLGTDQQQGRFAAAKIPAEPVEAVIKRGKHEFTVKLDFRPILKRLPRPPGGQAGEKEVRP